MQSEGYDEKVQRIMAYLVESMPDASIGHSFDRMAHAEKFAIHLGETRFFSVSKEFIDDHDPDTIHGHLTAMGMAKIIRNSSKRIFLSTEGLSYS
ncbi:MAG: hypothetical protein ABIL58_20155 [Pseudomonadota bacterium]